MNISQEYEIENLLNDLGIEVDDSARISDGEITYFIFSSSNLESEQEDLIEILKIDKLKYGLYCSNKTNYVSNEILNALKPVYTISEQKLWEEVVKNLQIINKKYYFKTEYHLFDLNQLLLTLIKWNGKLAMHESDFNDFINDLNMIIRLSCKYHGKFIIDESYMNHPFWRELATIRNKTFHHSTENEYKKAIKQIKHQKKYLSTS
ncbi:hypothetical protein [Methanobacterium ferruginis]|uniref:hypothetical protein n=1 Tax=Methanobacterium ferruginis TaxID=710191 RepID=UPI00257230A4|nr:hypothetical protein [Methanobacterium ferruginis]BDZ66718.1 hypothetical protein GCM10025860_01660 [Methanobacterium ferruginis]